MTSLQQDLTDALHSEYDSLHLLRVKRADTKRFYDGLLKKGLSAVAVRHIFSERDASLLSLDKSVSSSEKRIAQLNQRLIDSQ